VLPPAGRPCHQIVLASLADVTSIVSPFVPGRDFWEELRAWFVHGAMASPLEPVHVPG